MHAGCSEAEDLKAAKCRDARGAIRLPAAGPRRCWRKRAGSRTTLMDPERCNMAKLSELYHARQGIEEPCKIFEQAISVDAFHGRIERSVRGDHRRPRHRCRSANSGAPRRSSARQLDCRQRRPLPPAGPTESPRPPGAAPPSAHRCSNSSPDTAPDPSVCFPCPMQIGSQSNGMPTNCKSSQFLIQFPVEDSECRFLNKRGLDSRPQSMCRARGNGFDLDCSANEALRPIWRQGHNRL